MLDVAKKTADYRSRTRVRHAYDNAAAELRQQFQHLESSCHFHADNADCDAGLRASSIDRSRVHTGNLG
jgi:hypothetical protein